MAPLLSFAVILLAGFLQLCIGCTMPEEIPEDMRDDMNQTYWDELREQQRQRGCNNNNNVLRCPVRRVEIVTINGKCRDIKGLAACMVFDRRYHTYTQMWPHHRDCRTTGVSRRHAESRRLTTHADPGEDNSTLRNQARNRARLGFLPSNLNILGHPIQTRVCKVHQRVSVEKEGRCVRLRANFYGCRYLRTLFLWHPVCAVLEPNTNQRGS